MTYLTHNPISSEGHDAAKLRYPGPVFSFEGARYGTGRLSRAFFLDRWETATEASFAKFVFGTIATWPRCSDGCEWTETLGSACMKEVRWAC